MTGEYRLNSKRVRLKLEADPYQAVDLRELFLRLAKQVKVIRKAVRPAKFAQQARCAELEPEVPIAPFDPEEWKDLSVNDARCTYSSKGITYRITIDSHSPRFLPFLDDLIMRCIPFKVYDILNEDELHTS